MSRPMFIIDKSSILKYTIFSIFFEEIKNHNYVITTMFYKTYSCFRQKMYDNPCMDCGQPRALILASLSSFAYSAVIKNSDEERSPC